MAALPIDLDAFNAAPLTREPFAFLMLPRFVKAEAMAAINSDYPEVPHPGSFPLSTLQYGPAFAAFVAAIQGPEFTRAVEKKLGVSLTGRPTMVTARGQSAARDGQIHTDSRTKLVTVLIYMNNAWEAKTGRLRLLHAFAHLRLDSVEIEARAPLHRRVIEEGLDFLGHDLLDKNKPPELIHEPAEVFL